MRIAGVQLAENQWFRHTSSGVAEQQPIVAGRFLEIYSIRERAREEGTNAWELFPLVVRLILYFRLKDVSWHLGSPDIGEEFVDGLA